MVSAPPKPLGPPQMCVICSELDPQGYCNGKAHIRFNPRPYLTWPRMEAR